jgi:Kef-type K+ transport system membrane component KefB
VRGVNEVASTARALVPGSAPRRRGVWNGCARIVIRWARVLLCGAWFVLGFASAQLAHAQAPEAPSDAWSAADAGLDADTVLDASPGDVDAGDAGSFDAGSFDGGASDGGTSDGGWDDAGAALPDAGPSAAAELIAEVLPEAISETVTAAIASETTTDVVRTLLGLVGLLALAWLAGHERVRRFEERLGIAPLMVSGLPFVLLGLIARAPGVAVLTEDVVVQLTPLLQFGLGWIGFHTGFQLDSRSAESFPKGSTTIVILLTAVPFVLIAGVSVPALYLLGLDHDLRSLLRDATLLGLAGALSAPAAGRIARAASGASELVRVIGVLDDVVCVVGFAIVAAWLRPATENSTWVLPEVGWVFVTFGIAAVLGLLTYVVLRGTESSGEKTSLLLGSVCLTTGIAAVFSLPPLVVCFLAGVLLRNLPGDDKHALEGSFSQLERPIYHLFLLIVGALWRPEEGAGWLLLPAFLVARTLGRWGGARLGRVVPAADRPAALAETDDRDLVLPPMGQLAIAFVITAQTLYESPAVRAMVNAVVVSAVVLEVLFQLVSRRDRRSRVSAAPTPPNTEVDGG